MKFLKKDCLLILLLVIITVLLYSISVTYPIMRTWDDFDYIIANPYLSFSWSNVWHLTTHAYYKMYYPVTMLSYMLDYNISGFNSISYHIQNIIWHLIAVIAAYKIFRSFKIKPWIAFVFIFIFTIHPQRVESVVWLSERKDVTCAAFYLWTLYFYIKIREEKESFAFLPFLLFLLALLSKPMAISIPAVITIYEFSKLKTFNPLPYLKKFYPYYIIMLVFIPITYINQAVDKTRTHSLKLLYLPFYNLVWIIKKTLLPTYLNPNYPRISISETYLPLIIIYIAIIIIIVCLLIKINKKFIFSYMPFIIAYIAVVMPIAGLVPFGPFEQTDRWTYIPSLFIYLPIAILLNNQIYNTNTKINLSPLIKKYVLPLFLAFYAVLLAYSNYNYQQNWSSALKLFLYACEDKNYYNPYSLIPLSDEAIRLQRYELLFPIAERFTENAKTSTDTNEKIMSQIAGIAFKGMAYYYINKKAESLNEFKKIESHINNSIFKDSYNMLFTIMLAEGYYSVGNTYMAAETIKRSLESQSPYIDISKIYYYNGFYHFYRKEYNKALENFILSDLWDNSKSLKTNLWIRNTFLKMFSLSIKNSIPLIDNFTR